MRAFVDQGLCIGCELCAQICPSVFRMDETGKAVAVEGDVPPAVVVEVETAAASCPVDAIRTAAARGSEAGVAGDSPR